MAKRSQTVGLVGSGKFADAKLFRTLALSGTLGPVKAPSVRVASRISNTLRAGHPVATFQEFERCSLILISVPDAVLTEAVQELASVPFAWKGKAVVLCSALQGSDELTRVAELGAHVGSLCAIPGFEHHWVLVEGDRFIGGQVGRLIDGRATRVTSIEPSLKPFYLAALACTGSLFVPMLIAAAEALQQAGVSVGHTTAILEKQIEKSTRAYFNSGRKAAHDASEIGALSQRLSVTNSVLACYLDETLRASARLIG